MNTTAVHVIPSLSQRVTIAVGDSGTAVLSPQVPVEDGCTPNASLLSEAQHLIPTIPLQLTVGTRWSDTVSTDGCRGAIPTMAVLIRNYIVVGDTAYGSVSAIHIKRMESIEAKGMGHQGQHRVSMSATGTGYSDLYIDPVAGRLLGLKGTQATNIDITTSGRTSQFLQHTSERITLANAINP